MDKDSKFTRDSEGYIAVRTVGGTEALPAIDKDYLFARDENGNIAMRVVGSGGGGGGSVDYNRVVEKATVIPDASTQEVGKVYMYMGESNGTYTHGYIYENVAEQTATDVSFSGSIISSWAVADFVNYLQEGGSRYNEVTNGTLTYDASGNLWDLVGYNENGIEVLNFHEYTEDLEDFGCVFASETHQDGDTCTFTLTTEVSGKKWQRMDVQPAGGTGGVTSVNSKTGVVVLDAKDVSATPQYTTMPTASASNAGTVAQYTGTTNATYTNGYFYVCNTTYSDASATISQTVGSGLTDLAVDVETFESEEQPTGDETVSFVATETPESINPTTVTFDAATIEIDPSVFLTKAHSFLYSGSWENIERIYLSYDGDNNRFSLAAIDIYGSEVGAVGGINATTWGITVVGGTLPSTGTFGHNLYYTPATVSWAVSGTPVAIADYGVSYTGTPGNGDELTVVYTAPAITGYAWNQANVQPAPETPDVGIEWKTKVDLPLEYTGASWQCTPYWTVSDGLPDGEYEFYISTKCCDNPSLPLGEVIYKIIINVDNSNGYVYGRMGYVFDGNYRNVEGYMFALEPKEFYNAFHKNNNDFVFYCNQIPFISNIQDYMTLVATIPECWKMSAIKNVNTGQEYIATGTLNLDGSYPQFTLDLGGFVSLKQIGNQPGIPNKTVQITREISELATNTFLVRRDSMYSVINIKHEGSDSEFFVKVYGKVNGNSIYPDTQEIIKATGVFEDCYVAVGSSYMAIMGVDTTTVAGLTGTVNFAMGQINNDSVSIWFDAIPQGMTPIGQIGPRGGNLTLITADTLGEIVQYTGATNASYTNGYWYKSTGTVVSFPESIVTNVTEPQGEATVTIDITNFIDAMVNLWGWNREQIETWLTVYYDFTAHYYIDTSTLTELYIPWYGWTSEPSILQYVTISYTGSQTGDLYVGFSETYTPAHQEVQNPSWDRVDVQPTYTAPATMPTLTVADWNNSTQTVNVTGVTASNAVIISPAPANAAEYASCGVLCTAQGSGTLTFTCQSTPTNDLTVNVIIL